MDQNVMVMITAIVIKANPSLFRKYLNIGSSATQQIDPFSILLDTFLAKQLTNKTVNAHAVS